MVGSTGTVLTTLLLLLRGMLPEGYLREVYPDLRELIDTSEPDEDEVEDDPDVAALA